MAIEAVIELDIKGIEQLDALENRLNSLRSNPIDVNFSGSGGGSGGGGSSVSNVTFNEYNTNIHRQTRSEIQTFSRTINATSQGLGNLAVGFTRLTKAIVGTGGLLSGITSMATIAGLMRASQSINQQAFLANAVGANPGDIGRLQATFGRLTDASSLYRNVMTQANAPYSMLFTQMGMSQQQAKMMKPEQLLGSVVDRIRQASKSPFGASDLTLKQFGLEGIVDVEDLMRFQNMSESQFKNIKETSSKYRELTQIQKPEEWQDFQMKMSLGNQSVRTMALNIMEPVLAPLQKIFDTLFMKAKSETKFFTDTIERIRKSMEGFNEGLSSGDWGKFRKAMEENKEAFQAWFKETFPKTSEFIDKFDAAITNVATFFDGTLKTTIIDLADKMTRVLTPLERFADLLNMILHPMDTLTAAKNVAGAAIQDWHKYKQNAWGFDPGQMLGSAIGSAQDWAKGLMGLLPSEQKTAFKGHSAYDNLIMSSSKSSGINPALLFGVAQQESHFNPMALSNKGAMGMSQFMPGTWAEYGQGSPYDPSSALTAEGKYLLALHKMLGGGEAEMIAGYNAGPGGVRKAKRRAARHGADDWTAYLPAETQGYLKNVMRFRHEAGEYYQKSNVGSGSSSAAYNNAQVRVNVNNNSSAQAEVQVSRMGGASNTANQ